MATLATSNLDRNDARARFRLLVGLKGDGGSAYAVEEGVRIAQRIPGCALELVHVMSGHPDVAAIADRAGHLRLYVEEKIASLGGFSGQGRTMRVAARSGDPVAILSRWANEHGSNLLMLGPPTRHLFAWPHARLAQRLVDLVTCPVVVAGPQPHAQSGAKLDAHAAPVIEPPCHACVEARFASNGATWWCTQHDHQGRPSLRPHTFSYQRELPLGTRDRQVFLA